MAIRILFTIPNFITAGSGRAMLNIIERLDRRRFEPAVCVSRKGGVLDEIVEDMGVPFLEAPFTVPAKPYLGLPIRAWRAARVFRLYRFALWHSFHYGDDYTEAIIAKFAGARAWIYTKKNMNWYRRAWYVRTFFAARVAAQNRDMMRDFFASKRLRRKAVLVPRGVDLRLFHPQRLNGAPIRRRCGVSPNAVVVGCVAHLVPVKGHPTLIEAVARVPEVHLLIAGRPLDEQYAAQLRRQVDELAIGNRVHFLGAVSDIPGFWSEVDIGVLPTWAKWRQEGCPVALLEMIACGRACIATDVPGSRDIIEHGQSGLIVPPEDVDSLVAALRKLSESPELRRRLGEGARARALNHFSLESEVAAHEALYSEALGLN